MCVTRPRASAAGLFEIWRKVVSPTRGRGQVVRPKLDRRNVGRRGFDCKGIAWYFTRRIILPDSELAP
jgi:hypothetical protein